MLKQLRDRVNKIYKLIFSICLILFSFCFVFGSILPFKIQSQLFWQSDGTRVTLSSSREAAKFASQGTPIRSVSISPAMQRATHAQGFFWGLRINKVQERTSIDLVRSADAVTLEKVGTFRDPERNIPLDFIVPLERPGYFLGASVALGFVKDRQASLVAQFRLSEAGWVELDALVELALDQPVVEVLDEKRCAAGLRKPYSALAPFLESLVQTPDHLVLVATRAGILWVFDRQRGALKRTIRLYDVEDKNLGERSTLEAAILGVHPTREGKLLVAARDEIAFNLAGTAYKHWEGQRPMSMLEPGKPVDPIQAQDRFLEACRAVQSFGDLVWWEVDPATGKKLRHFPAGVPERFQSFQELRTFAWTLELDGRIRTNLKRPAGVADPAPGASAKPGPTARPVAKPGG